MSLLDAEEMLDFSYSLTYMQSLVIFAGENVSLFHPGLYATVYVRVFFVSFSNRCIEYGSEPPVRAEAPVYLLYWTNRFCKKVAFQKLRSIHTHTHTFFIY